MTFCTLSEGFNRITFLLFAVELSVSSKSTPTPEEVISCTLLKSRIVFEPLESLSSSGRTSFEVSEFSMPLSSISSPKPTSDFFIRNAPESSEFPIDLKNNFRPLIKDNLVPKVPELPEVEITCRGLEKHLSQDRLKNVLVFEKKLRWPVPENLNAELSGAVLLSVSRRAKWLLLDFEKSWLIIHLGMSGSLRVVQGSVENSTHDRFQLDFISGKRLIFNDPRKFGSVHHTKRLESFEPFQKLAPEPWDEHVTAESCLNNAQRRTVSIKSYLLSGQPVVGVGNIYACEILFESRLNPFRPAQSLTLREWDTLLQATRDILSRAIDAGGTTLRDFSGVNGKPGYFFRELYVYGRDSEPCKECGQTIQRVVQNGRSTFFCKDCQP